MSRHADADAFAALQRAQVMRKRLIDGDLSWHPERRVMLAEVDAVIRRLRLVRREFASRAWREENPGYEERRAVQAAMAALADIMYTTPTRVRSREGMLRLVKAVYGRKTRVRWSWPADQCARAHRARVLFI